MMVDFGELWRITRDYGVCPECGEEVYLDVWDIHKCPEVT